jgi:cysteine sulfinate desulfinase/cysteine desulfurase-like protein
VVLTALGATHAELKRTLRVSGGWETGESDWKALADAFDEVRQDLDQSTRR